MVLWGVALRDLLASAPLGVCDSAQGSECLVEAVSWVRSAVQLVELRAATLLGFYDGAQGHEHLDLAVSHGPLRHRAATRMYPRNLLNPQNALTTRFQDARRPYIVAWTTSDRCAQ